jgi:hypothetical protein
MKTSVIFFKTFHLNMLHDRHLDDKCVDEKNANNPTNIWMCLLKTADNVFAPFCLFYRSIVNF